MGAMGNKLEEKVQKEENNKHHQSAKKVDGRWPLARLPESATKRPMVRATKCRPGCAVN